MTARGRKWGIGRFVQPNSLRFQLLSRSLAILSLILLLIGLFQYVLTKHFLSENKAESLRSQAKSVPRELFLGTGGIGGGGVRRDPPFDRAFPFQGESTLAFIDESGNFSLLLETVAITAPKFSTEEYLAQLQKQPIKEYKVVRDASGVEQLVVLHPTMERGRVRGLIQVSTSTKPLQDILISQSFTFVGLSLLALLLGLLAFFPVLKRTLVPLSKMVRSVEQIDAGNLAERFPVKQGQFEIDRLSASFNGMLERLEASFQAEKESTETMRRFIADASHELRTPLTSIHGFLEVLLRGAASHPVQLERALKSMYSESERINKLVNDLLLLARLDRSPTVQLTEGHLDTVVQEMEPQLRILAGERTVLFQLQSETPCLFDSDKMKQVILNLFQNAVQHTDPFTGSITVRVSQESHGIELSIQDNGPGIPEEDLPHVFDRFYRVESSRARKYGGAGLGLSITKTIVDLHGGLLRADTVHGGGTTFRVWLPAKG
jgi:two-component system, OmpR family, sensor kinase